MKFSIPARAIALTIATLITVSGCGSDSATEPPASTEAAQETPNQETPNQETPNQETSTQETSTPETPAPTEESQEERVMARYEAYASWATDMLIQNFWNDRLKIFVNQNPYNEQDPGGLNYWWKAHAVDSMVDAYERTKDDYYMDMAKLAVRMTFELHGGIYNDFIDDMQWMCLAALRIYDNTGDEEFKTYAERLWRDIKTAWWDDELGGLGWNKTMLYNRNACSNGPGALIAARMYQRFGDEKDLEWAIKIYDFLTTNLVDPETGVVWDGLVLKDDGTIETNKAWVFTYNAGTMIGSAVELYKITGDEKYLQDAEKTSAGTIDALANFSTKVLKSEGQGDGGLFKGILLRYWAELYMVNRDENLKSVIYANAESLKSKGSTTVGLFGPEWDSMYSIPVDLTCQLSGHFLFEAAARIERFDND